MALTLVWRLLMIDIHPTPPLSSSPNLSGVHDPKNESSLHRSKHFLWEILRQKCLFCLCLDPPGWLGLNPGTIQFRSTFRTLQQLCFYRNTTQRVLSGKQSLGGWSKTFCRWSLAWGMTLSERFSTHSCCPNSSRATLLHALQSHHTDW